MTHIEDPSEDAFGFYTQDLHPAHASVVAVVVSDLLERGVDPKTYSITEMRADVSDTIYLQKAPVPQPIDITRVTMAARVLLSEQIAQ